MKCSTCGRVHRFRWFARAPDPISFYSGLASFGVMVAMAIVFFPRVVVVPIVLVGWALLARAKPSHVYAKEVILELDAVYAGGRRIPYGTMSSIDRENDEVLIGHGGSVSRIALPADSIDAFVRHAQARLVLARLAPRTKVERVVREAMLAHGAEAVIYRRRSAVELLTLDEARRVHQRNLRIFVRRAPVATYRTSHDPRFLEI